MRTLRAFLSWPACVAVLAISAPLAAQECPTGASAKNGFMVERGDRSVTEVLHAPDEIVRTILRYDGKVLLETTQLHGLLSLERIDRGRRTTFTPKSELARIFPLKTGQRATAEFEAREGEGRSTAATVVLDVKAKDALFIGPCRYEVLKIERSESRGERPARVISTDYYAPELKLVIAREYKESDGRSNLVKFDRIRPIKP